MTKSYHHIAPLLVFVGLLLAGNSGQAQVFAPPTPPVIRPDTTEAREVVVTPADKRRKAAADSAKRTEHMFRAFGFPGIRLTRPGKAALLAAILPGAGQIYNHRWWKLPLVYGSLGGVIYGEYFYQTRFRQYVDASDFLTSQAGVAGGARPQDISLPMPVRREPSIDAINTGIRFYRGNRDLFYLYIGLAYSLQIVDALVDAHLKSFDVSEDLSLHWQPALLPVPGRALALPTAPGVLFALRVK
ncbi:DUF5683 domain-containing protein [Hymenobacter sp. BT770]|uniref:DUF5683 domain-containing protein n=1 Tax=Hymenobacter sp. BT770 TaxID=2886942 RepID=UPI001D12C1BF|nr:DUF5683 domain-containing protein [Hymenobacter sp. BT770]MCC3152726.1 DUF5683 domain-containing protein [Hymenobacter sp. BT770]MDO3414799.1 DUF5683 domain-containing protein [Hymenobacter sp. BT770]